MGIEIKSLTLGMAATNAYIIGDTYTGEAIVIDPVDNADLLYRTADEAGWTIRLILATHAHFDHVLASKALKEKTGAPFWTHTNSVKWLETLPSQGMLFGIPKLPEAAKPDRLLTDARETITIGSIALETLYTPGHAPDHIAYWMPDHDIVFSGDTLFEMSIGRTDLPGGDHDLLMRSIVNTLLPLGDAVQVLPGHMNMTTIGRERLANPFIRQYLENLSTG
ncbi:MAG: MBL fold metallo-hydrolase [Phototrophicaceae bacterium]